MARKALNEVYSSACPDSDRQGRGPNRAGAVAVSMRHLLGAYLVHVMGHLVHSSASDLNLCIRSSRYLHMCRHNNHLHLTSLCATCSSLF